MASTPAAARCSSSQSTQQIRGSLVYKPPCTVSSCSVFTSSRTRTSLAAAAARNCHRHHFLAPAAAEAAQRAHKHFVGSHSSQSSNSSSGIIPRPVSTAVGLASSSLLAADRAGRSAGSAAGCSSRGWPVTPAAQHGCVQAQQVLVEGQGLQQPAAAAADHASSGLFTAYIAGQQQQQQQQQQPCPAVAGSDKPQQQHQQQRAFNQRPVPRNQQQQQQWMGPSAVPSSLHAAGAGECFNRQPLPKSHRRARDRSPLPHPRMHRAMKAHFGTIIEEYEERYTSWMHSQEEELLRLQAQNAPSSELQYHALQHDQQKKKWEQKWGAPTGQGDPGRLNRLHLLPQAAEQLKAMQGHSRAQQPQPQQTRMAQLSAAVQQSAQQRLQQPQRKTALSSSSSSSSKHSRVRAASSNVLDIPDDSADVLSDAAAATASAAQLGSYSSQAASAAVVVKAVCQEPMDSETLDGLEIVFLHLTLPKLMTYKMADKLPVLAEYILSRPDRNEHSFGAVFDAYARADRLDLALATWDRLAGQGVDIGPIGSSALIKACARQRDLETAKKVFEQLLRRRVTFNGYTYHCLLQLCGSAGSLNDALAVYNLQRLETQRGNLPNSLTYVALTRAMLVAGRCELVQQIFENMLEDEVTPHPALYCNLLTAAGRAGNLGFARYLYQHMAVTLELPQPQPVQTAGLIPTTQLQQQQQLLGGMGGYPSSSIHSSSSSTSGAVSAALDEEDDSANADPDLLSLVNALLNAHAQVGALQGAVAIYRQELLGRGLQPDGYTCTALLTAAARLVTARLAWSQVAEVVELTHHFGITLSTQLGTALINAYRRVRSWEEPQQQQQQPQQQPAAPAAAGKRSGSGKGRKRGGRVAASDASSSSSGVEDALSDPHQQQQQHSGPDAAWEHEQLAAIGAQKLPGVSPVVCASLHAAQQVLLALQQHKLATSNSYVTMLCFLLEQGQVAAFKQLYEEATGQYKVLVDEQGWDKLQYAATESGAGALVAALQQQAQQVPRSQREQQEQALQQQRLRARQQQLLQQQQGGKLAVPVAR